jgi:Tol biopolymer transport system component
MFPARSPAACALLALALARPAPPHARKLSAPLPRASLGDVREFQLVPGEPRVVYLADGDTDELFELYAYDADTRALARLAPPRDHLGVFPGTEVDPSGRRAVFRNRSFGRWSVPVDGSGPPVPLGGLASFSPDGEYVLYHDGQVNLLRRELYSQRTDGSAPASRLSGEFRTGNSVPAYEVTADSARVVFLGNLRATDRFEVFGAPIDGSAPFRALNGRLDQDEDVTGFDLAAEAALVVYRADQGLDEQFELFAVPADGSAPSTRVLPFLPSDRDVGEEFRVTSDGAHVAFLADLDTPGVRELYGVPLGGGSVVKLSPPLAPAGSVLGALQLAPDGRALVFRADPDGDGAVELFAARLDGSTPPTRLSPPLAPGETLGRSELGADSRRVLFLRHGGAVELFSAPLDGSAPAVPVHPPLGSGGDVVRFELAGERVVYRADQESDEVLELFSAPLDASAPALRLHPPLAPGREILPDFRVSSDGRWLGFLADLLEDERFEVFLAPSDGSAPPRRASAPSTTVHRPVGDVLALAPAGDFAVYAADQEQDEVVELWSVSRDGRRGPRRLHAPAVEDGDVSSFRVTPDGLHVVFDGDLEVDGRVELYSAPADASAPPVTLGGPLVAGGAVTTWRMSTDGSSVVFAADALRDGQVELFVVPVDGSASPLRLDPPPHRQFGSVGTLEITPDGSRVVYTSDKERRDRFELHSVALDGSAAAVRLSSISALGGDVLDFRIGPGSARVVYRADQDTDDLPELYGAPLDGSAPPVKLSEPLGVNERVWDYEIGAGDRVVFTAGLAFLREIASVPADGSQPPRRFLAGTERSFDYFLTPAGTRVLFRSRGSSGYLDVFAAPVDASMPAVRLDGPIPRSKSFQPLFPDEDTVLYFAGTTGRAPGTYRAPLDGSAPPELVDASGAPRRLSADGSLLMVYGSLGFVANDGLYVLPADGSAPARRLGHRLPPGASVFAGEFAAGGDVLYVADEGRHGARELYASGAAFAPALGRGIDGSVVR